MNNPLSQNKLYVGTRRDAPDSEESISHSSIVNNHFGKAIALGSRLKDCRNVLTLGVCTNFSDYNDHEAELIRHAEKIYYPSSFYADLFDAMGKKTFPSYHTYKFVQDKIMQTAIFDILKIPHPRTKVFYGKRQKLKILDHFSFPFIAKVPKGSAMGRGVSLIKNTDDLSAYISKVSPAYIQEYLEADRDIRAVIIGKKIVHSYWRISQEGEFRSNVAAGAEISLEPVPSGALDVALETAHKCCWDDVGIDIIENNGNYYVIEANMKYGREGFRKAGIDYTNLMETMIENGEI